MNFSTFCRGLQFFTILRKQYLLTHCKHSPTLSRLDRNSIHTSVRVQRRRQLDGRELLIDEKRNQVQKKQPSKDLKESSWVRLQDETDSFLTVYDWEQRWIKYQRFFIESMGKLASLGHLQKAKSLMKFMEAKNVPVDEAILHNYLTLCVEHNYFEEMFKTYDILKSMDDMLPAPTLSVLIRGFCKTELWKKSLDFLEQMKSYSMISSSNYWPVVTAALLHKEFALGQKLIDEMRSQDFYFDDATMRTMIKVFHCRTNDRVFIENSERIVHSLFDYMRQEPYFPSKDLADEIGRWFKTKRHEKWRSGYAGLDENGICGICGKQLDPLTLTDNEFKQLHDQIMEKVIKSKDVYLKTSPQELKAFIEYVNDGPSYDVVIDGLNVAHIDPFVNKSLQLRQVVVYFAEQLRKRVLVIGRRHMLSYRGDWQAYNMTWIKEIADCFFTDNVSHDDPFLLYATLHSGNNAVYVSRDMMRDHKALLDKQTHAYFVRWQRSHQFVPEKIRKNKPPLFQRPLLHDTRLQTDGKSWHIPIDFELSNQHWKLPNVWLCATRTK